MEMLNYRNLLYWINERELVRQAKEEGRPKPWSTDPIFQVTYFCNVRREDDKVTRWIREFYSPHSSDPMFEFNILLARFLNWPPTLAFLEYQYEYSPERISSRLKDLQFTGHKIWGAAYVVTTHGLKMDKLDYLTDRVLESARFVLPIRGLKTCNDYAYRLMAIEGVSTFMAGQIIADLKNTIGHPLRDAPDWRTFALPGPGSLRGMDWLYGQRVPQSEWLGCLHELQDKLKLDEWVLCAQDVQNCLCEFDKFMRVSNGTGRSKRRYNGTGR